MPELRSVSLSSAKVGDLVTCGEQELVPVDDAGIPVADIALATGVIAREAVVQGKRFSVSGLEAKRAQLTEELARVNAILASVGR